MVDSLTPMGQPRQRQRRAAAPCYQYAAPGEAAAAAAASQVTRMWTSLSLTAQPSENNGNTKPAMERTWRYAKKPLLRVGAKGASASHGNSLRQLLEDHTVVKVKINTSLYNGDLETAFESLKQLAVNSGASPDMELLQSRAAEQIILVSLPGTRKRVEQGDFPPPEPSTQDE